MVTAAAQLRERLDHPVIDSDGHSLEFVPSVIDRMHAIGGRTAVASFEQTLAGIEQFRSIDEEQRRALGMMRPPWWALPALNTYDRATAMLPRLLRERLDEFGLDFAVVYPTLGLFALSQDHEEIRRASCRAFNEFYAEAYGEFSERLTPAALIPMNHPDEAIDELEYAVGTLGLKTVVLAGHVLRPLPSKTELPRSARWLDTFGLDSLYDYDPVWAACERLRVSPTFHSSGMGWGSRASGSNYIFNHLGNFAAAGEATCRALILSGVPRRYPDLRFAFLEGGVSWACALYADLLGHWEKRNRDAIHHYDPAELDRAKLAELFEQYGSKEFAAHADQLEQSVRVLSNPDEDRRFIDEFAPSGIDCPEQIQEIFERSFAFGCEADDPMNALAFNTRLNPRGARLRAIFGSDIGHWDVPDMRDVLTEAYELVERQLLSEGDFRSFVFDNPISLWTDTNPEFFTGTIIETPIVGGQSVRSPN
ncbi:MAG: amidohydrolase family protein [Myxococcota bacterium]